jgi:hypothetical protein
LDDFRWVPLSFWLSLDQIKVSRSAVGKCSLLADELWSQIFKYVRQPPAEQLMPQREQSHPCKDEIEASYSRICQKGWPC